MNRILVSQGHENSIGLEVFLKSFLLLGASQKKAFLLFCNRECLIQQSKNMGFPLVIHEHHVEIASSKLSVKWLDHSSTDSISLSSLKTALSEIRSGDLLLTIPTTKKELSNSHATYTGHTDYFRRNYLEHCPVMLFVSENIRLALLTEHIQLNQVESSITKELLGRKIEVILSSQYKFNNIIFAGINPHCGEEGILGDSDEKLRVSIDDLRRRFKNIHFAGPISGDTILSDSSKYSVNTCVVSPFHDQGLAPFKAISGIRAANITIGLPFLRLSPDHGTAFELYGRNKANYYGMLFTLKEALRNLNSHGN